MGAQHNYRDTEVWKNAKALLTESFRLVQACPEQGKPLADRIVDIAVSIVGAVPQMFKSGGYGGNYNLEHSKSSIAQLEALCETGVALGYLKEPDTKPLLRLLPLIESEVGVLMKEDRRRCAERMAKRTAGMFPAFDGDEDED